MGQRIATAYQKLQEPRKGSLPWSSQEKPVSANLLIFSSIQFRSDLWPPELQGNTFLLLEATKFMVTCHSSNRKRIPTLSNDSGSQLILLAFLLLLSAFLKMPLHILCLLDSYSFFKVQPQGLPLVVQCIRPCVPKAGGPGVTLTRNHDP